MNKRDNQLLFQYDCLEMLTKNNDENIIENQKKIIFLLKYIVL